MRSFRILLVIHLFRPTQLKKLTPYIHTVISSGCEVTTYVSVVDNNDELSRRILELIPDAHIITVDNKGYDIGPFFQVLQKINLDDFDYIVKFHTKDIRYGIMCNIGERIISRCQWADYLLDAVAGDAEIFKKNLSRFQQDPKLGMIASSYLTIKVSSDFSRSDLLKRLNISQDVLNDSVFVAGTIFMVRSGLLKPLVENGCIIDQFQDTVFGIKGGTLAHDYEKILCQLIQNQGCEIKGFDRNIWKDIATSKLVGLVKKFIFSKRVTSHGYLLVRFFMLPVYHKKI